MAFERVTDLVSIVVTTYNRENYIVETLDSLLSQTYGNIEIIIVDDGSEDNTVRIVNEYMEWKKSSMEEQGRRSIIVAFPRNVGYAGPLTTGMYLAKGEFIAIQDSDDLSHPERIEKQVSFLRNNPQIDLVGTLYAGFKDGAFPETEKPANWIRFGEDIKKAYSRNIHCICHGTILFRGTAFDRLGGYTRRSGKAADAEFLSRYVLKGVRADNIPEVLYYYRRHDKQMSRK